MATGKPEHDRNFEKAPSNEDTQAFNTSELLGDQTDSDAENGGTLFETYERRSLDSIIEQQRAYQESQAAQAARTILRGADLPEFEEIEEQTEQYEDFENSGSHAPRVLRIRVQKKSTLGVLTAPGTQAIYVLVTIATLCGMLALAFSTDSPQLLLIAGVATPMLLPICVWRWVRWLDSSPYYYRLLTSLGEDARNLLQYRLLWKKSSSR
jgi:hypothetical protein